MSNGRDEATGRFAKGNKLSPGRPRREIERAYLDATLSKVPLSGWRKVVARALADAENGDHQARQWLGRVLGLDAPSKLAMTDANGNSPTLADFLSATAAMHSTPPSAPPNNVVDVDAMFGELAEAQEAADTSGAAAVVEVAGDGTVTYSAAGDEAEESAE